uniref:Uncharacterized protein n=1 Tax=Anguilla anguilla TaxID=7936 RepID=A0A0E9SMP7_ANGAN
MACHVASLRSATMFPLPFSAHLPLTDF